MDELALYKRLLTAEERAWLHNDGQYPAPILHPTDLAYAYSDPAHAHAVTSVSGQSSVNSYQYDPNGSQITRIIGADTFNLLYDAENRMVGVKKNNVTIATFVYDGDGRRVKSVLGTETTLFIGVHYEKTGSQITKYYYAGTSRVAMRVNGTLSFLLSDHLGSTSITTNASGAKIAEMRYTAWGEVRYTWGSTPTDYTYTGQRSYMDDPTTGNVTEGFGLMFYNARWYDPYIGRFAQADSIIPLQTQGVQAWDRYAGMNNNPVRYTDPSGHRVCDDDETCDGNGNKIPVAKSQKKTASPNLGDINAKNKNHVIDVDLTPEQVQDLINELTWWIDLLNKAQDGLTLKQLADATGVTAVALMIAKRVAVSPKSLGVIAASFLADLTFSFTSGDLQEIRFQIAMQSKGGEVGVNLGLDLGIGSWGVSVNDKQVVHHYAIHPVITPKGTMNFTQAWIVGWYLFDYGR